MNFVMKPTECANGHQTLFSGVGSGHKTAKKPDAYV